MYNYTVKNELIINNMKYMFSNWNDNTVMVSCSENT